MIDLLTSPDEQEIADTIHAFLADAFPISRFRRPAAERATIDGDIIARLAEIGCIGLGLPEQVGGTALGPAVEALAFREYGRFLVSPAIIGTVLAARIAAEAGDLDRARALIAGDETVGLAIPVSGSRTGALAGEVQLVACAPDGGFVHWSDEGAALYDGTALPRTPTRALDDTVSLARVECDAIAPTHRSPSPETPLLATLFVAAMQVGMGEAVRDMAVAYATLREQFGKPIGSFQAIKHKCADMALQAEAAWCETVYAALELQRGGADATFHVLNAKMLATTAVLAGAKENIQIHGGLGYTAEVEAHLFLKRGHLLNEVGGNIRSLQRRLLRLPVNA